VLSAIVAVTLMVQDLKASEHAYQASLHYQTVERGQVSGPLAEAWGASATEDRDYIVMQPESGEPVYIRFVESRAEPRPALRHLGWSAAEMLIEDPAQLEKQLADSPFRVVGPPAPLEMNPAVVAMQALGPSGEMLYLTRIPPGASKFNLGSATSFVDRVFIVVLGVHDIQRTLDFYGQTFGLQVTAPAPSRVDVIADAWGVPRDSRFPIAIVRLPERFLIEVDEFPAQATAPPGCKCDLPAGMAMVSFTVQSLDPYRDRLLAPPRKHKERPYLGQRSGVLLGPSGERIELVEAVRATAPHP
jgi:catechol 2,3-dioxygenase-like lactoylglutathione lyase family enzyme